MRHAALYIYIYGYLQKSKSTHNACIGMYLHCTCTIQLCVHLLFCRYPLAAVLCDVLRATNREKVQRVIFATFRVYIHVRESYTYVYIYIVHVQYIRFAHVKLHDTVYILSVRIC